MSLKARRTEASFKSRFTVLAGSTLILAGTCGSALALRIGIPAPQAQAQSAAADPLQVPSGVMAEHALTKVAPVYPDAAKQAHIMGSVILAAHIGTDGHIESLGVMSGPQELQDSALTAVRQWVYEPYLLNGNPVPVDTTITVNYQLAH